MALSAENTLRIQQLRQKVLANTATREEKIEALKILRADRVAAQTASNTSRAAKAPVNTQAALAGLMALKTNLNSPT